MTKQNQKCDKLLSLLKRYSGFVTAKTLSEEMNFSEKTLYRLIKEINQIYFPEELISSKKGSGFKLNQELLLRQMPIVDYNHSTPESRRKSILERLLLISPKSLLIYDLCQEYYVSDAVIMKDRRDIQELLTPFNLTISTRSGSIFIKGSELDIRRAIAELVSSFNTIDLDELTNITRSNSFNQEIAEFVQQELLTIEKNLNAELPYPYNINIFSHLYIMIERLSKGRESTSRLVELSNDECFNQDLLVESKRVINNVSHYLHKRVDDIEIHYLYQYLYSSRFQLSSNQQKVQFSPRVIEVTRYYFDHTKLMLGKEICQRSPLFIDLANHISPLLRRLDNKIRIKNKMLDDITSNYPDLFQEIETISQEMVQEFGFPSISRDEIGFLTLYFARFSDLERKPIGALVMCSSGIGTSELLKSKIQNNFPDIHIIDVVSYKEMKSRDYLDKDFDLLITTVDIEMDCKVDKILVSALMNADDQQRLRQKIEEINYGR